MKNRRSILIAAILVVVLCVGIGYAAVNDELTIGGTVRTSANNTAFDEHIYLSDPTVLDEADGNSAQIGDNNDSATFTCTLTAKDQTARFRFTVNNTGDLNAAVSAAISEIANNNGYFEVTHDVGTSKTVNAGGTLDVTVTVKLLRTPAEAKEATFTVTLTATAN